MSDQFEWKAEITFKGTAEEFNKMSASLAEMLKLGRVGIDIPGWHPGRWAGLIQSDIDILGIDMKALTEGMPRFNIKSLPHIGGGGIAGGIRIPPIAGGIRSPHLHIENEVVLLDRDRFKTFVGEVARELAERQVDANPDYVGVMSSINTIATGK
jgi:hypothetical protein